MTGGGAPRVIVVGAGVVGAACAYFLARSGAAVTVLDSAFPGGGVTAAGMGHLVVLDDSELQFRLTQRSVELWKALNRDGEIACELVPTGTLWVAANSDELEGARSKREYYNERGVAAELLSAAELREAEPELREGLAGALHVPEDCVVYPPGAALALLRGAERYGAVRHARWRVDRLLPNEVCGTGGTLSADVIVVAAGLGSRALLPSLPVRGKRGHLAISIRSGLRVHHQLVELGYLHSAHASPSTASVAFNLQPRSTGQILLGSSREPGEETAGINRDLLAAMLRRGGEYVPRLAGVSISRVWTGVRPATADNLPLIGEVDGMRGVYAAVGHEGLGITTATGTGEMLAALVTGTESGIDPRAFSPGRASAVWGALD